MRKDTMQRLEQSVSDLGTLPEVAVQVIEKCSDPEVSIVDLATIIEADQVIAARILRLANSAFYARSSRVDSVRDAVMLLGLDAVRALGLSVGVYLAFESGYGRPKAELESLWQHCIAAALCAKEIARRCGMRQREQAFVAGLLHEIGQLVLLQHLPEQYARVLELRKSSSLRLERAEEDVLGTNHAEAGGWLVARWGLPGELRAPIELHHQIEAEVGPMPEREVVRIVQVADWLAASQGLPGPWEAVGRLEIPVSRASLPLTDDALVQLCFGLDKRVSQFCLALGLSSVPPEMFQKALYQANQALARLTIDLDVRNRQLQRSMEELRLLQRASATLAASDDLRKMLESFLRDLCEVPEVDYAQCMVPLSAEECLVSTVNGGNGRSIESDTRRASVTEWRRAGELRSTSPVYLSARFRLLNGTEGELVVRHAKEPQASLELGGLVAVLGLAVERALAHREAASASQRLLDRGAQKTREPKQPAVQESDRNEHALRALGEMTAGALHELNNALAVLLGQAQLGLISDEVSETHGCLGVIERTAKDCAITVRRLQEFSRGTRRPAQGGVFDLAAVARETIEITRPRWKGEAERNGVKVNVIVDLADPLPVQGDAGAFRQVLTNLVFNALDAMPNGGTLSMRGWSEGETVLLSVGDTGVGMAPEVQKRLFEPFFSTKGDRGCGLGLSVCKRVVDEHLGRIEFTSRLGEGTVFTVSLPKASQAAPTQSTGVVSSRRPGLKVLVVDDEPQVRDVLLRMLRLDGHSPEAVGTAREGLELFSRKHYDLVLTDLGLPDMNGWHVIRALKAGSSSTPVILITGWADGGERPRGGAGADAVLVKPFGISELRQVISSALTTATDEGKLEDSGPV